LLVRIADTWEGRLQSPESATEILERILKRRPDNVRALLSLARIYENASEIDRARETLDRAIKVARSKPEAAELAFRLGRLEAEVGGEAAGEPHFRRALKDDPGHPGAQEALEKLARGRGDWSLVAELLERRLQASAGSNADPKAQKEQLVELGRVY